MRIELGIKHKQIVLIGAFFLLTFALTFWFSLSTVKGILYHERENNYRERIANLVTLLKNKNESLEGSNTRDAYLPFVKGAATHEIKALYFTQEKPSDYFFILDSTGTVILHPYVTEQSNDLASKPYVKKMITQKNGNLEYDFSQKAYWAVYSCYKPWGWIVVYTIPRSAILRPVKEFIRAYLILSLIIMTTVLAVAIFLLGRSLRPIHSVSTFMLEMAQGAGDLTKRLVITTRDEMGSLARGFNAFIDHLKDIVIRIRQLVKSVGTAADSLVASSHTSREALKAVSMMSQSAADFTTSSSVSFSGITLRARTASAQASSVAESVERMNASLVRVSQNCQRESRIANKADEYARSSEQMVARLQGAAKKIEPIIEIIGHVAQNTNLLALNASIEAACAGDAGRGFSVVAGEIKLLARQTAESTGEIEREIERMNQVTTQTVENIGSISAIINEFSAISRETAGAVDDLTSSIRTICANMQEVAASIDSIADEITQTCRTAGTVAEKSISISKSISEITSSIDLVFENAQGLYQVSSALDALVLQFKV